MTVPQLKAYIRTHKLNRPEVRLGMKKADMVAGLKKIGHWDYSKDKDRPKLPPRTVKKKEPAKKVAPKKAPVKKVAPKKETEKEQMKRLMKLARTQAREDLKEEEEAKKKKAVKKVAPKMGDDPAKDKRYYESQLKYYKDFSLSELKKAEDNMSHAPEGMRNDIIRQSIKDLIKEKTKKPTPKKEPAKKAPAKKSQNKWDDIPITYKRHPLHKIYQKLRKAPDAVLETALHYGPEGDKYVAKEILKSREQMGMKVDLSGRQTFK
jgi:hypothetical protein